ncbi:MAG: LruC domain-containing protein [Bacteroidales bacterium]|nr:LruC domain-containing protein [Bacteroidales bacterium]
MNLRKISLALCSVLILSGCQRDLFDPDKAISPLPGLQVPNQFDWKTTSNISLTVEVADEFNGTSTYRVDVFTADPEKNENALPISSGAAKLNEPFSTNLDLPQTTSRIYIRQMDTRRRVLVKAVDVNSSTLKCDFRSVQTAAKSRTVYARLSEQHKQYELPANYEVLTDLPATLTGTAKAYLFRGTANNSTLEIKGAYLFIEGNVNLSQKLRLTNGGRVIILDGGKFSIDGSGIINTIDGKSTIAVMKGGTFKSEIPKISTYNCDFVNYGTFISNELDLDAGTFYSNGDLNLSSLIANSEGEDITIAGGKAEIGTLTVTKGNGTVEEGAEVVVDNLKVNTSARFVNMGKFKAKEVYVVKSELSNQCKFEVENKFEINSSTLTLGDETFLGIDGNATFSITETNMGSKSVLSVKEKMVVNGKSYFKGVGSSKAGLWLKGTMELKWQSLSIKNVELVCSEAYVSNSNIVKEENATVVTQATITIPANECNGSNTPDPNNDRDGDGVPDDLDEFPDDPNNAFTEKFNATFAFEDNWPYHGDYDMNDAVFGLDLVYKLSAQHKVNEISISMNLRALGANKDLAAGLQMDKITPSQVASVSGYKTTNSLFSLNSNGLENGQLQAVFPLSDDLFKTMGVDYYNMVNVFINGIRKDPQNVTIIVKLAQPTEKSLVSMENLNVFIVLGKRRDMEIHLPNYRPTDLANQKVFGHGDDRSLNKGYYRSHSNMMWGIMLPNSSFQYPQEMVRLTDAYSKFSDWANSGGTTNLDWYNYPVESKIFK